MTAPTWTPAQAAEALAEKYSADATALYEAGGIADHAWRVRWFCENVPQPQPITGTQLGAALLAEGLNTSAGTMAGTINALDSAAARLSSQPATTNAASASSSSVVTESGTEALSVTSVPQPVGVPLSRDRAIAAAYRHVVDMIEASSSDKEPAASLKELRNYFDLLADTYRETCTDTPQPVGVDVEAVARWMYDEANAVRPASQKVANMEAYLSRHLTAAPRPSEPVVVKDECEFCRGQKGGVRGNENVVGGVVCCDDCTVLLQKAANPPEPVVLALPVEVDDYDAGIAAADGLRVYGRPSGDEWRATFLSTVNARLAARAADVLPCRVVPVTAEHVRRVRAMLVALGDDVSNTETTDELIAVAYNALLTAGARGEA